MEPYDLEQMIREETKLIGLSGGDNPGHVPGATEQEIELAVDEVCQRDAHMAYDLPIEPEYMFDPKYGTDSIVLVLGWLMPDPF